MPGSNGNKIVGDHRPGNGADRRGAGGGGRPLVELTVLSDHYTAAIDPTEKLRYLAAGEVLRSSLDKPG